jgi:hypothetical protein
MLHLVLAALVIVIAANAAGVAHAGGRIDLALIVGTHSQRILARGFHINSIDRASQLSSNDLSRCVPLA